MKHKLFVYGTLRYGGSNHDLIKNEELISNEAAIKSGYGLFVNNLPYLVEDYRGLGCFGEIYYVSESTLQICDLLENHPHWYRRTIVAVIDLNTGFKHDCWAYVYQGKERGPYVRRF